MSHNESKPKPKPKAAAEHVQLFPMQSDRHMGCGSAILLVCVLAMLCTYLVLLGEGHAGARSHMRRA